ncbi:MAG TPA: 2-C-methyl-D-erythritol 4-phosphate cytidylyltransferase [candidate division Zixibacteria bacterium]|nr:2-C-methyl-D-erythritol 4-phosphate cytidylyltransferase [candidate division Zixibacteria bacterium]
MVRGVIIVAGGAGARFGGELPKAFTSLAGEPLVAHCARIFAALDVNRIVVAVPHGWEAEARKILSQYSNVIIVEGGETRKESVRRAFAELSEEIELVAVHDAARPLLRAEDAGRAFSVAVEFGASALAVPVADTLKLVDGGFIERTIPRDGLWAVQTPQVFRRELLSRALELDIDATDDCALVEALGEKVRIVEGRRDNIKITFPEDLALAEAILSSRKRTAR